MTSPANSPRSGANFSKDESKRTHGFPLFRVASSIASIAKSHRNHASSRGRPSSSSLQKGKHLKQHADLEGDRLRFETFTAETIMRRQGGMTTVPVPPRPTTYCPSQVGNSTAMDEYRGVERFSLRTFQGSRRLLGNTSARRRSLAAPIVAAGQDSPANATPPVPPPLSPADRAQSALRAPTTGAPPAIGRDSNRTGNGRVLKQSKKKIPMRLSPVARELLQHLQVPAGMVLAYRWASASLEPPSASRC